MTTPTITPKASPQYGPVPLTFTDSCDACGYFTDANTTGQEYSDRVSQALVRVTLADGKDLLFCHHHYADNELALLKVAVTIQDESAQLTAGGPGYSA